MVLELKVCAKCHLELPLASFAVTNKIKGYRRGQCRECDSARVRAYYASNAEYREKVKANTKKWAAENPDSIPAFIRRSGLKRKYGLAQWQYEAMLAAQGGKCALCKADNHGRNGQSGRHGGTRNWQADSWPVDHCHTTGAVRGLLCNPCNVRLGGYEKLLEIVGEAALLDYLTRPSPVPPAPADIRKTARFVAELPPRYTRGVCSVEGCGRRVAGQGMCGMHYQRLRDGRDLSVVGRLPRAQTPGVAHHNAKLTVEDVIQIRASTETGVAIAARFNVSPAIISEIRQRKTWKHIE
jgi:hypothetical protein